MPPPPPAAMEGAPVSFTDASEITVMLGQGECNVTTEAITLGDQGGNSRSLDAELDELPTRKLLTMNSSELEEFLAAHRLVANGDPETLPDRASRLKHACSFPHFFNPELTEEQRRTLM